MSALAGKATAEQADRWAAAVEHIVAGLLGTRMAAGDSPGDTLAADRRQPSASVNRGRMGPSVPAG